MTATTSILKVRFGGLRSTATPAASAMINAAAGTPFKRYTPCFDLISNSNYEGDWDAEITSEGQETVANWVLRLWPDSSIETEESEE